VDESRVHHDARRVRNLGRSPTGQVVPGGTFSPTSDGNTGSALDFASGWDDRKFDHGRPSDVTFAMDGRLFLAQDVGPEALKYTGIIVWVAPLDLRK
jgi:hypothetical protein